MENYVRIWSECSWLRFSDKVGDELSDKNWEFLVRPGGRDISVGMETRCELEWSGIVARRGQDFPHPSRSTH